MSALPAYPSQPKVRVAFDSVTIFHFAGSRERFYFRRIWCKHGHFAQSPMKTVLITLGVLAILAIANFAYGASNYNGLVNQSQAVDAQWAQVQNVYQRRADLIPNLVNTVKGAANFEQSTLTAVTNARASVGRVQIDPNH